MPDRPPKSRSALAAAIWRRLFEFLMSTATERNRALGDHDLTPNDARALGALALAKGTGRTMSSLADDWGCDASYATSVIDRLDRRGLATRRTDPNDRRVRLAVLTPKGEKLWTTLSTAMYRPPAALAALDLADLRMLWAAVDKLPRTRS